MVGAVGTDLELLTKLLTTSLDAVKYSTSRFLPAGAPSENSIRLSSLLRQIYKSLPTTPIDDYIDKHMSAGDEFRKTTGLDEALAVLAISEIVEERKNAAALGKLVNKIIPRHAYILQSLKNPREVTALRDVYGDGFLLVAAYSSHDARRDHLARRIAESRSEFPSDRHLERAEGLIKRDLEELGMTHGQNVRDTFHRADVFLDTASTDSLRESVVRFVELLFGNTFHTPTRQEYGMFHAQAAALRSAEPGRQVGAAIATEEGDIVAVGVNEVPKAGGGLYWCGDNPDEREFRAAQRSSQQYYESNQRQIRYVVKDTLKALQDAGWLQTEKARLDLNRLVEVAMEGERPALPKSAQIRGLIEFGRAVHAEMAALIDAARRGVSVAGCTMYVTTFPCHLCARHIVAAGIRKLVFIEPYAKSRTADLYPDSIAIEQGPTQEQKVKFEPFVGVAPRQYMKLFTENHRMSDGKIVLFDPSKAEPRFKGIPRVYLENEIEQVAILKNIMKNKGLVGG